MNLTLENLPERVWQRLEKKAEASGRTIEAEAAAIIATSLAGSEEEADPVEAFLKTVDAIYGSNRPQNVVDEFLAERRKLWGEEDRGTEGR